MKTLKLLKFRSLDNRKELGYIKDIIENNMFKCSKLWNLNDPMEGVFSTYSPELVNEIFSKKNNTVICSFSGEKALKCPLMWGYYANGFKGAVIEIEVKLETDNRVIDEDNRIGEKVIKVEYNNESLTRATSLTVEEILTRKLPNWSHEYEYRFLKEAEEGLYKIGTVNKIYLGAPYYNIKNREQIKGESKKLLNYEKLKAELIAICEKHNKNGDRTISVEDYVIDYKELIKTDTGSKESTSQ